MGVISDGSSYRAFMADRITTFDSEAWKRARSGKNYITKKRKEAAGKTLNYRKANPEVQKGLQGSRATEWEKWMKFNAAVVVQGKELDDLIAAGHKPLPMQWIETDKNEHLRRPDGPYVEPKYKSRLVARGDLEAFDQMGLRSDSPTCDTEVQNLIFSFAASNKLTIRSADITNAYF